LQHCSKADPKEIWDVYISNPVSNWENREHRPNESDENEKDICGSKIVVLQTELEVSESEVENEIEDEGQSDPERNLFLEKEDENLAE